MKANNRLISLIFLLIFCATGVQAYKIDIRYVPSIRIGGGNGLQLGDIDFDALLSIYLGLLISYDIDHSNMYANDAHIGFEDFHIMPEAGYIFQSNMEPQWQRHMIYLGFDGGIGGKANLLSFFAGALLGWNDGTFSPGLRVGMRLWILNFIIWETNYQWLHTGDDNSHEIQMSLGLDIGMLIAR